MIAWFAASHLVSMLTGGGLLKLFLGNLLGDLKAVAAWLRRHSIWLTVSIALAAGWGVDHIISHRHSAKLETQVTKLEAQLKSVTKPKDEQRLRTKDRIIQMTKIVHDGNERAKIVETAPLPGNCKTPPQILGADL